MVQYGRCTNAQRAPSWSATRFLTFNTSTSGNGAASEDVWRAARSVQPGHVLPRSAETVHQRQERPDATPPEMRHPGRTKMRRSASSELSASLPLCPHLIAAPQYFFFSFFFKVFTCCCCPLLAHNCIRMLIFLWSLRGCGYY